MFTKQHLSCRTLFQTLPQIQVTARQREFAAAQLALPLPAPVTTPPDNFESCTRMAAHALQGNVMQCMPTAIRQGRRVHGI